MLLLQILYIINNEKESILNEFVINYSNNTNKLFLLIIIIRKKKPKFSPFLCLN